MPTTTVSETILHNVINHPVCRLGWVLIALVHHNWMCPLFVFAPKMPPSHSTIFMFEKVVFVWCGFGG